MRRHTALTIAGSDSSGGAGIEADLKTMLANGVYGCAAITAVTAQNTTGVFGILEVPAELLKKQLDAVFTDICPDAVKIGMVRSAPQLRVIQQALKTYEARQVVLDPVIAASTGVRLMGEDALLALQELLPLCSLITPNAPEAEVLTGLSVKNKEEAEKAARQLCDRYGCAVLLKGGHLSEGASDVLVQKGCSPRWFTGDRIDNPNTHGTGCTLSSAIAANLAKGMDMEQAVDRARRYLRGAIAAGLDLGEGSGPLDHGFDLKSTFVEEI